MPFPPCASLSRLVRSYASLIPVRRLQALQTVSLRLLVGILWCVAPAVAEPTLSEDQRQAIVELESTIHEAMTTDSVHGQPTPGLALALVGPRGALWSQGFGLADVDTGRPVTADTPFFLASVSKTFIAAAMATEVEGGRLDLHQPVRELLPFAVDNPRVRGDVIRVYHLAAHTSGIRDNYDFYDPSYVEGDPTIPMDSWIASYLVRGGERFKKRKNFLRVLPGTEHEYSNIGAALGAVVVEQTSGLPYRELLEQRIFEPLGLRRTAFDLRDFPADTLAVPYDREGDRFVSRPHYGLATYADGQLRSSANDLARYVAMMIDRGRFQGRQILQPTSIAAIEKELHPNRGGSGSTRQALYWALRFDGRLPSHSGADDGALTFVFYHLEWRTGGVILMNSLWDGSQEFMFTCLQALTDAMRAVSDVAEEKTGDEG